MTGLKVTLEIIGDVDKEHDIENLMEEAIEKSAKANVPVSFKYGKYEVFVNAGYRKDLAEKGHP